jgi:hypothetical protein
MIAVNRPLPQFHEAPQRSRSVCCALAVPVIVALLTACATPARVEQMTVAAPDATRTAIASTAMREAVTLGRVSGGKDTNPLWVSNISSADFEQALQASLRSAELLAPSRQDCRLKLTAQLLSLAQPAMGLDMTVTASVLYTLIDCRTQKEVWVRTITLPYTAAFSDSLLGVERLKLANEGAARVNIRKLVELLAVFDPP